MRKAAVLLLLGAAPLAAQEYRAFWADAFHYGFKSASQVEQMLDDLVAAKANAVVAEVRRRGDSYYLRSLEPIAEDPEYTPSFDALQYLVERAHARGIEVHAWFPVLPVGTSNNPEHVAARHGPRAPGGEMWMTVSNAGRISTSLDPGHPDAARYTADVILEPAQHYEVDGIHLDYVRYPEDANYGWNPTAVARFQRLYNRTGAPAVSDPAWAQFRRDQVTALVRQIYLRAFAIRPSIKVSAALITWGNGPASDAEYRIRDAYSRVFQDWRGWLEEGIIDLGIPMNYFRENAAQAAMFNRWIEYQKDRQYGRGMLVGPAIYLNPIEASLAQLERALAPSTAGNRALGVCFYSYASTNTLNAAGAPVTPNAEFYRAVGERFGEPADVPVLPWKAEPTRGHAYGWLEVEGGPAWLKDGAGVFIESDTGAAVFSAVTDGTGFFGAVDLPPDRYRVRIERAGRELYRATPRDVAAGAAARFDIRLKAADFADVMPRVARADKTAAAPGDIVVLQGGAFAPQHTPAAAVPLPVELGRTQVVVNGTAAPLFSVAPGRIELQLPYMQADAWHITVRHAGVESEPFRLAFAPAAPVILSAARAGEYLIVYATGLGAVDPAIPAGLGGGAEEPYSRATLPVTVLLGGTELAPSYAGLAPYYPGRYQINVRLPEGFTGGEVRVRVGGAMSNWVRL
jgi:uncharacterized protein (TIGR03437 family)